MGDNRNASLNIWDEKAEQSLLCRIPDTTPAGTRRLILLHNDTVSLKVNINFL